MKTKRLITKKGIALSTLATLILAGLSFAIALTILIQSGLLTNLQSFMAVAITTIESHMRGITINALGYVISLMAIVLFAIMWLGSTCRQIPYGAAVCLGMYAAMMILISTEVNSIQSSIPWVDIPNPEINMPTGGRTCAQGAGIDPEVFKKEVAERSVDCWSMFAEGNYDPLRGKVPPNPRTCFVINFNIKDAGVSFQDIKVWMKTNDYPGTVDTYWKKSGSDIILENNKDAFDKKIKTGRMFIKYGDSMRKFWTESTWGSADCSIREETFNYPGGDDVYWCIDERATQKWDGTGCDQFKW